MTALAALSVAAITLVRFQQFQDTALNLPDDGMIYNMPTGASLNQLAYDLETRVMSHDESLHTYFSWLFQRGQGYQHSPMMHGPLQFHLLALSYFIFGVSDFTARIPAVLFSIATVWMVWYWRRYLGKTGTIIAGFLMVISPYMLYYGRYVRNEAFAGFSGEVSKFELRSGVSSLGIE